MRTRDQKISIDLKRRAIAEAIKSKIKTRIKCPASAFLCRFYPYIADILAGCGGTVYLQKRAPMAPPKPVRVTAET